MKSWMKAPTNIHVSDYTGFIKPVIFSLHEDFVADKMEGLREEEIRRYKEIYDEWNGLCKEANGL